MCLYMSRDVCGVILIQKVYRLILEILSFGNGLNIDLLFQFGTMETGNGLSCEIVK